MMRRGGTKVEKIPVIYSYRGDGSLCRTLSDLLHFSNLVKFIAIHSIEEVHYMSDHYTPIVPDFEPEHERTIGQSDPVGMPAGDSSQDPSMNGCAMRGGGMNSNEDHSDMFPLTPPMQDYPEQDELQEGALEQNVAGGAADHKPKRRISAMLDALSRFFLKR